MKTLGGGMIAIASLMATPAFAQVEQARNDKAVWIALGVVFMGSLTTIASTMFAFAAKKKSRQDQKDAD